MIPLPIHYEELENIFSKTIGAGHRSIAITAADHGEGVSMIAYALARRAVASGRRTLLVDFNTETPSVALRLGVEQTEWSPAEETRLSSIVDLKGVQLSILSAPQDNAHILDARDEVKMRQAMETWLGSYDCVILDTSPLTRTNQRNVLPDLAAAVCDGAIMVVLAGRTSETKVTEAVGRLNSAGVRLLGTVINDRHNPSLSTELARETHRLDRFAPKFMTALRNRIQKNAFLMQQI